MACYSSNFGNKLQMMVGIGKEYHFTLNFDMPRPFAREKRSYGAKWRTANQIAEQPLVSQSRGRATNSLWGRDCALLGWDLMIPSHDNQDNV